MNKTFFSLLLILIGFVPVRSQSVNFDKGLALQQIARQIQIDTSIKGKIYADSLFTRKLVSTLKNGFSFKYDFDSLTSIKIIKSPDDKFKIYTWQIDLGDGTYRQRGAIQMNTSEGNLKLFPLFDQSDFVANISLGVTDKNHWMGAVYYEIIPIETVNGKIYTLLGYDEYTVSISRKVIDILHFENGEPIFGGDYFTYPKDPCFPLGPVDRFVYQYKKGSNALIKYDPNRQVIVLSELTSIENDLSKPNTLVPSGDELFFKWVKDKWTLIN